MNKERNCTSKNIRRAVAMIVLFLLPEFVLAAAAAAADSCVEDGTECLWLLLKAAFLFEFV